ncbi:tetratricopeptide repeat protein [Streptomyces sp. 150FB]|uniref:tetratricopeptide repeat protein n=1 Tax=Streptomyces sp. 150FB TaxID=1576605 RepID=UPI0006960578|nr:tetratricopeptide repeat protein [Streptomyces sp. 150FB]
MKWRRRKPASQDGPEPAIRVAETGDARATGGGTATTGYQGPPTDGGSSAAGAVSAAAVSVTGTGDATAASGGVAVTGYVGSLTIENVAAPRTPAPWPCQVGVIPREAAAFQERDEAARLRTAVTGGGTAVLCQVLRGTGGVGKTQLAARYAREAWVAGELDVLIWVGAGSRSAIISAYAQAAEELIAVEPGHPERSAMAFMKWLEPRPPGSGPVCRWLVVLDDVADPADVTGLWPVKNPHGRTVVTTRRRDVAVPGQRIDLGVFTPGEAAAYLSGFLGEHGRTPDPRQIHALAGDLGHLPLALSQAAAYIVDAGISIDCPTCTHSAGQCPSYRRRLADRTTALTHMLPEPGGLPDDQLTTVAATWSLSVERADALRPAGLARPALQLAAMLDPNGIPEDVLTGGPAREYLTRHRTWAVPEQHRHGDITEQDARDALRVLHRLNLVDHDPDTPNQAVRTHQLIQRATRDTLTAPGRGHQAARSAADALLAAWPAVERDTALAQTLRANTATLTAHAQDALHRPAIHVVLYQAGRSLGEAGQATAATTYFHRLTETVTQRLGPDHPDTLLARSYLVFWQSAGGDTSGFEALLADQVRVLGPDHPHTLLARNNFAFRRGDAGDAVGAVTALEALLPDLVRVLGADHEHTLVVRNNLARFRGAAGGVAAQEAVLADLVRALGPDHPYTLVSRNNLAAFRGDAGDAAGAVAGLEALLPDLLRVLGADHPHTLLARNNLASYWGDAGDAAGAVAALEALLPDLLRALGEDHPHTVTARNNLAFWRGEVGDGR